MTLSLSAFAGGRLYNAFKRFFVSKKANPQAILPPTTGLPVSLLFFHLGAWDFGLIILEISLS